MIEQKVLDWFAENATKLPEEDFKKFIEMLRVSPEQIVNGFERCILSQLDLAVRALEGVSITYERGSQGTSWQIVEHFKKRFLVENADVPYFC